MYYTVYTAPIGALYILEKDGAIIEVKFDDESFLVKKQRDRFKQEDTPVLKEAKKQLDEYFKGDRKVFDLPLKQAGSPFQEQVWEALSTIPYGESKSYADIAEAIGNPKAVRAIGQANRRNALPIFIPCHRVIGKDRTLTGYAGTKTGMKAILLELEGIPFVQK
ncbi:methylated-DNA--[protein]-cysteine S-methyltransferase [Bacillus altitudinis MN12]|uniref:Methylated-DNA--protein-cysteine methyltransferase n=2 Tax=Bacillus TaxID=1386 RepID=A0A653PPB5_BACAB|nr:MULTISPECIES: methylated-DNA--[protein]-cysteine S-methyltransferase [Bacillus]AHL71143.1 cysteine methyltransferase [Bacillus pumilus]MBR0581958.1 methylated-DNA--[protein]-cysteine S-methyltransferase [Bacillus altitudinis MN12]MBR0594252.1 methylated-DNA--[protein]-cysteine S-methyltransferase [Bacillus altitudinis C16B11]MDG3043947.1 methylated-DNA--[protein]-cysteine S-methyltransferase [Bacillus sp. B6(2022)]MDH8710033.1 methylated-DNA-[protein]-cysteine S-methyltransferase [Micromono